MELAARAPVVLPMSDNDSDDDNEEDEEEDEEEEDEDDDTPAWSRMVRSGRAGGRCWLRRIALRYGGAAEDEDDEEEDEEEEDNGGQVSGKYL